MPAKAAADDPSYIFSLLLSILFSSRGKNFSLKSYQGVLFSSQRHTAVGRASCLSVEYVMVITLQLFKSFGMYLLIIRELFLVLNL